MRWHHPLRFSQSHKGESATVSHDEGGETMNGFGSGVIKRGWHAEEPRRIDAAITNQLRSIADIAADCGLSEKRVFDHVRYWIDGGDLFYEMSPSGAVKRRGGPQPRRN